MTESRAVLRYRATPAFIRSVTLAVLTAGCAVLVHRPALIVLAAPFAVWALWGLRHRPGDAESAPVTAPTARTIALGETVGVRVAASQADRVVDVALAPAADVDLDPPGGAVCAPRSAEVRVRPRRWGRTELPEARITLTDPWALWRADTAADPGPIEVSPLSTLPGRGDAIPHPVGVAGIHRSPRVGDGAALADIRPYRPGDRLTRINWRVTSRSDVLHTNATSADRDTDVLVVLDTLLDATTGGIDGDHASSLDDTIVAGASLLEHYLRLGDRVGVHDLGELVGTVRPRGGIHQLTAFTTRLSRVRPEVGAAVGVRPVGHLRPGSFVVVCTPLLHEAVIGEIAALAQRRAAVVVVDTLPERLGRLDAGPADHGRLRRLVDPPASPSLWEEAWVLRRLQRDAVVARLRLMGVPVTPWRGVSGIAALAAALSTRAAGGARTTVGRTSR